MMLGLLKELFELDEEIRREAEIMFHGPCYDRLGLSLF